MGSQLKDQENAKDRKKAHGHFLGVLRKRDKELVHGVVGRMDIHNIHGGIGSFCRMIEDSEKQYHHDGTNAAQSD